MEQTNRQFIRHPSEVPIEYSLTQVPPCYTMDTVSNVSQGGLSFHSKTYIEPKQWLHLYIPIDENYFEADAQVRWCRDNHLQNNTGHVSNKRYDVGVSFRNNKEAFSARMVEQICYIEEYKKRVEEKEGRYLSSDQAAAEWIAKYADDFPAVIN